MRRNVQNGSRFQSVGHVGGANRLTVPDEVELEEDGGLIGPSGSASGGQDVGELAKV